MDLLPNLIYYSCIATRSLQVVAHYLDADQKLITVAANCLAQVPPFHRRFSYTTRSRTFGCIIDASFIYCAIVDEALERRKTFAFLEQVRHEFKILMRERGLPFDGRKLEAHFLHEDFAPIFRCLVAPFEGIPQKEKRLLEDEMQAQKDDEGLEGTFPSLYEDEDESLDPERYSGPLLPFTPLIEKSSKHKKKKAKEGKNLDAQVEGSNQSMPSTQLQKVGSVKKQMARRLWWRNCKCILFLDAIICVVLLTIWLGVCGGIRCLQKSSAGT